MNQRVLPTQCIVNKTYVDGTRKGEIMKWNKWTFFLSILASANIAIANSNNKQIEAEYDKYVDAITSQGAMNRKIEVRNSKLYIDALWDITILNTGLTKGFMRSAVSNIKVPELDLADQVRLEIIQAWPKKAKLSQQLEKDVLREIEHKNADERLVATVFTHVEFLRDSHELIKKARKNRPKSAKQYAKEARIFKKKTKKDIQDLFFNSPQSLSFKNGKYNDGVRIFVFCRYSRQQKCLMIMKDKNNQPVYLKDGKTLWSHPALGMSRMRLPSWRRNGNTPEGVHTIDGVIRAGKKGSKKQRIFGSYSRFILNFVPRSHNEQDTKSFLPESASEANWWKSAVVARNVGRNLLRVHGTGVKRVRKKDPFYPMRPTLGCIMQRELKFDGVDYKDQRLLLDKTMIAMGMKPHWKNESKIRGVLYLIELDKQKKPVTLEEINEHLNI